MWSFWQKKPKQPVEKNLTIEFGVIDSDVDRARKLLILSGMVMNSTAETMALNMSEGVSIYRKLDLDSVTPTPTPTPTPAPIVEELSTITKDVTTTKTKSRTKQKEV